MPNRAVRTFGASVIVFALATFAFIQVGRGDDATAVEIVPDTSTTSTTSLPEDSVAVTVSNERDTPFVYKVGLLGAPTTDNFWSYFGSSPTVWDAYVLAPTKASLYQLDPTAQSLVPDLASSSRGPTWDQVGWRVVVTLRGDSRWSDGEPITADDFEFTYDMVRSMKLGGQWAKVFPEEVVDVTALDRYRIEVRFSSLPSLDVWPHGVGTAPVMAAHFWEGKLDDGAGSATLYGLSGLDDPASGPLSIVDFQPGRIVGQMNPGYWGDAPDLVEYHVYEGMGALSDALVAGRVHTFLSPRGLDDGERAALENVEDVGVVTSPVFGVRYLSFNLDRAPMSDLEFRRAVDLVVDRSRLADEVAGVPEARTLLPASSTAWYDPARAASLHDPVEDRAAAFEDVIDDLEGLGYTWTSRPVMTTDGVEPGEGLLINGAAPAALTVLTSGDSYDPARKLYAEEIAKAVAMLGFEVIPVSTDFDTVIDLAFEEDDAGNLRYDMAILGWSLGNPGLPSFYGELLGSGSAANNTGYQSQEMDDLLARYETARSPEQALDLIWQIEALVMRDLPYLPLYSSQIVEVYRTDAISFTSAPGLGGIQGSVGALGLVTEPPPR